MKKFLIAASFALIPVQSFAADLPVKVVPPVTVRSTSWTGCYLDGGVGFGTWKQDQHSVDGTGVTTSIDVTNGGNGWLGRVGGGCDYQLTGAFSKLVVGGFGDFDFMNLKGTSIYLRNVSSGGGFGFGAPGTGDERESSAWSVGGRVGYLVTPSFLTFASAGWTQTRFDDVNLTANGIHAGPFLLSLPATTYDGWFIGSGTEYALPMSNLFWRTEYRFARYSARDISITGDPFLISQHARKDVQTVTSSLVWRFNQAGADKAISAPSLFTKAPVAQGVAPVWTGCYLNGGAGYGMWKQTQYSTQFGQRTSIDGTGAGDGWLARVGGGCDYQLTGAFSKWTVGALADYDFMDLKGVSSPQLLSIGAGSTGIQLSGDEKQSSALYVGGRVGYVITPTLLTFASAGWTQAAFGQINLGTTEPTRVLIPGVFLPATTYQGWFVGGGTEYALPFNSLFLRSEYRYANYSTKSVPFQDPFAPPDPVGRAQNSRMAVQTATASLVWKFNMSGSVVAKY